MINPHRINSALTATRPPRDYHKPILQAMFRRRLRHVARSVNFSIGQYPPPLKFGGSLEEFRVESLEVDLGLGLAEVASAPIPGYGRTGIAPYTTQAAEAEKGRVERLS